MRPLLLPAGILVISLCFGGYGEWRLHQARVLADQIDGAVTRAGQILAKSDDVLTRAKSLTNTIVDIVPGHCLFVDANHNLVDRGVMCHWPELESDGQPMCIFSDDLTRWQPCTHR